jgi:hypothetical protein
MAVYTSSQLADRVREVLYSRTSIDKIDALELQQLLLDFVDSLLNVSAGSGVAVSLEIAQSELVDNAVTKTHGLNTDHPVVFIKSSSGDQWGSIHFTASPVGSNQVLITFEEDLSVGSSVDMIVVKFV